MSLTWGLPQKEEVSINKQNLQNAWPLRTAVKDMKQSQLDDLNLVVIMKWLKEGTRPFGSII